MKCSSGSKASTLQCAHLPTQSPKTQVPTRTPPTPHPAYRYRNARHRLQLEPQLHRPSRPRPIPVVPRPHSQRRPLNDKRTTCNRKRIRSAALELMASAQLQLGPPNASLKTSHANTFPSHSRPSNETLNCNDVSALPSIPNSSLHLISCQTSFAIAPFIHSSHSSYSPRASIDGAWVHHWRGS